MVKVLDWGLKVSKFELHLSNYIHFKIKYDPPYLLSKGFNSIIAVLQEWLWY